MEASKISKDEVTLKITVDELLFLCNAVNEALDAIEEGSSLFSVEWDFELRGH